MTTPLASEVLELRAELDRISAQFDKLLLDFYAVRLRIAALEAARSEVPQPRAPAMVMS
jgi:hypothetical protein